MSAGQADNGEPTHTVTSPDAAPGPEHDMEDITPTLGFFDDIFDLSPSYVQDISWSMQPVGMFDEWSSGERISS